MNVEGLDITFIEHDCFRIVCPQGVVYTDPFRISAESHDADYVFITHEHFDHCSIEDISKIIKPETVVVATPDCVSKLSKLRYRQLVTVEPGKSYTAGEVSFRTIAAYNVDKFRSPGAPFHPKEDHKVGFVMDLGTKKVYLAGDTDHIPEMAGLTGIDIALVPVSGTYVMTPEEAAQAVNSFRPKVAIPMHYGAIVGDDADAQRFKELSQVNVVILDKP